MSYFLAAFVDDLREKTTVDNWFDEETLAVLAEVRREPSLYGRAMSYARKVGVDVRTLETAIRGSVRVDATIPERCDLLTLSKRETKRPEYVIDGLLPMNGLSVIAGSPKAGKSTFVRYLIAQVVNGAKTFNRGVRRGPALYYVLEEKLSEIVFDFRRLGVLSGDVHVRCGAFPPGAFLPTLAKDVTDTGAVFAVADPLFDVLGIDDINDYAIVNGAMKKAVHTMRALPAHLMFVHHINKSGLKSTASILGSRAIEGATDANIVLDKREDGKRVIHSENRYGTPIPSSFVERDGATGAITLKERRVNV